MAGFPRDLERIRINGADLAYSDRGRGTPVVFVHGTSQDVRTWNAQLDVAARSHRAIAYSRRYARPNIDIPAGQDDPMPPHVDDLLALLQALDAAPAHLVGSSWGGFISVLAAIQSPGTVRTLTLLEPPILPLFVSNKPRPQELLRLAFSSPADAVRIARFGLGVIEPTAKAYRAGDHERGRQIFGKALLGEQGLASLPADRGQMLEENQAVEVAQMLGEGFPRIRKDDVRSVSAPTLLVAGERSPAVLRLTVLNELGRLLPDVRRVTIPGAAHLMHEENADAFNRALMGFLDAHPEAETS